MESQIDADTAPGTDAGVYDRLASGLDRMRDQVRRVIVGQEEVVDSLLVVLLSGSHCLITGAPGLAKTLLVRTVSRILDLQFRRIQFTPDLMPADILGTEIIDEDRASGRRQLRFVPGPVFTNILLADEINRTPPKTQAALLEAMEEKQVTVAGERRPIEPPFFVLATQNPIELEGTFPLPEAQLDRFLFDVHIHYLDEAQELEVAMSTTAVREVDVSPVFSSRDMIDFARLVRTIPIAESIARYAVQLVQASRPDSTTAPPGVGDYVSWGAGTRGSQSLLLGAKAWALLRGRMHVSVNDVRAVAPSALRHRILTNFRADADHVGPDDIVTMLLDEVPVPSSGLTG